MYSARCSEYWNVDELAESMDVISFEIWFSVLTMIFRIACLENGDMKPPIIVYSHLD